MLLKLISGKPAHHIYAALFFKTTGAAGLEPAVTVLETVGLPLTDAPKLFYLFMWGMFMTGITELTKLQPILMQLFIFARRIISIFTNRAL